VDRLELLDTARAVADFDLPMRVLGCGGAVRDDNGRARRRSNGDLHRRGGFTGDTGPSDPVMASTTASIPKVTESSFWCHCIVVLSYGFVLNYIFAQPLEPPTN
jgi:hypothetical protein